jgi:hypothetical protein
MALKLGLVLWGGGGGFQAPGPGVEGRDVRLERERERQIRKGPLERG